MDKKKLMVFLFPEEEYMGMQEELIQDEADRDFDISDVFDAIIQNRYIDNGYDFMIATTADKPIYGINIPPQKVVRSKADYDSFYNRPYDDKYGDYVYMAEQLNPADYSEVTVGGYHLTDCVDTFVKAINSISDNAVIDKEVSNLFMNYVFNPDFSYNENYEFYNQIMQVQALRKSAEKSETKNETQSIKSLVAQVLPELFDKDALTRTDRTMAEHSLEQEVTKW